MVLGMFFTSGYSQSLLVSDDSTYSASSNAIFEVYTSNGNKGALLPRVTSAQRNAIATTSSDAGLTVYDTDTKSYWYWDGTQWVDMAANWRLTGNQGTDPSNNFLGTTDNVSLSFRTNNAERVRILNTGEVGIGTNTPGEKLDVSGNIRGSGELISTLTSGYGQFRAIKGDYGFMIRNDGINTYLLLTDAGDQYGSWGTLRPFRINNATGDVFLANGTTIFRHSDGYVGIGTNNPSEKLDVSGNVKFLGALMPNGNAGTSGQILTSQGPGQPPTWETPASIPLYGNNATSVELNSLVYTTNQSSWDDISGMSITFTPEHDYFYIFSSLVARLADNDGNAQYGMAMVHVRILVNGTEVAKSASVITDYDDQNGVITSGSVAFSGVRVHVSAGTPVTVKLQWQAIILAAASPWRIEINPTLTNVADHCVLTVFD